jgi:hypothetical protein
MFVVPPVYVISQLHNVHLTVLLSAQRLKYFQALDFAGGILTLMEILISYSKQKLYQDIKKK